MSRNKPTRRAVIQGALVSTALFASPAFAQSAPSIHIIKDPNCGCCTDWARILYSNGFDVTLEHMDNSVLARFKKLKGIPRNMTSCHTAEIEGYMIEGHVPVTDILRLLELRPDAVGLTVPDMPYGAPGMGDESDRDEYSVYLIHKDGSTEVFSHYPGA